VSTLQNPSIPVDVVGFDTGSVGAPAMLKIRNRGASPLVSLVSVVTYTGTKGSEISVTLLIDSWHLDYGSIGPGATGEVSTPTVQGKEAVAKVVVRPVYAEFEDGTHFGIQAATTKACLAGYHVKKLDDMKAVLAAYTSSGEDGLRHALKEKRKDLLWLEPILERQGVAVVLTELTKERRLRP
jgi:hypothetical protein